MRVKKSDIHSIHPASNGPAILEATTSDQRLTTQLVEMIRASRLTVEQAAEQSYKGQRWISVAGRDGINRETRENPAFIRYLNKLKEALA